MQIGVRLPMKTAGIIAEYNPFHNGHKYQLEETRKITGADYIIVMMSGNFVQRGYPALIDKYSRAEMALQNGADLVLELPVVYATASAEYFALGAVSLLNHLSVSDYVSFGSECGTTAPLQLLANLLTKESSSFQTALKKHLASGQSFPRARMQALKETTVLNNQPKLASLLQSPNNLLGIEYLKAMNQLRSTMTPITIKRLGMGYHDSQLHPSTAYPSATAIRKLLQSTAAADSLENFLPDNVLAILRDKCIRQKPVTADDFSLLLQYCLLTGQAQGFTGYQDITPDLSDKITKNIYRFTTFNDFCDLLKSKDITHSRISRSLLHILLSITSDDVSRYVQDNIVYYARPLGFRKAAAPLLKAIKSNSDIPLLSKLADAGSMLSDTGFTMLRQDILASHIYDSICCHKYNLSFCDEYRKPLIIL